MNIGKLRHRVTIQRQAKQPDSSDQPVDDFGQPMDDWVDVCKPWASIEALRGREYFSAQQTVAQSDHRVIVRYRPDIEPEMRLVHGQRVFDVQAVLDREGTRRWLELICKEVA